MGVLEKNSKGRTYCTEDGRTEPYCFYCGDTIKGVGVYWRGFDDDETRGRRFDFIHLHYGCAQKFLVRLARDIWQVEKDNRSFLVHKN
jgi:hypothetical protein